MRERTTRTPPPKFIESYHAKAIASLQMSGSTQIRMYRAVTSDGGLIVFTSIDAGLWHLSISARGRYPTWDEIAEARYALLPDNVTMAMLLPPKDEYVNFQSDTFHLHEIRE